MDKPGLISVSDIRFEADETTAMNLRKDQAIIFTGRIDTVLKVLGTTQINLVDVRIDP